MNRKGGPFALELEYNEATVVTYMGSISAREKLDAHSDRTRSKQIKVGMCGKDPKSIVFSPKGLNRGTLCKVPYAHSLVLAARNDEFVLWMEEGAGNIVEVPSARVNLPSLGFTHPPNLDGAIVRSGDDERQRGMEGGEIDASVMALEDILYGGERVECLKIIWTSTGSTLSQTGYVPHAYGLVHGC